MPLAVPLRDVYSQRPPPGSGPPRGDELVPRFVGFEGNENAACVFTTPPALLIPSPATHRLTVNHQPGAGGDYDDGDGDGGDASAARRAKKTTAHTAGLAATRNGRSESHESSESEAPRPSHASRSVTAGAAAAAAAAGPVWLPAGATLRWAFCVTLPASEGGPGAHHAPGSSSSRMHSMMLPSFRGLAARIVYVATVATRVAARPPPTMMSRKGHNNGHAASGGGGGGGGGFLFGFAPLSWFGGADAPRASAASFGGGGAPPPPGAPGAQQPQQDLHLSFTVLSAGSGHDAAHQRDPAAALGGDAAAAGGGGGGGGVSKQWKHVSFASIELEAEPSDLVGGGPARFGALGERSSPRRRADLKMTSRESFRPPPPPTSESFSSSSSTRDTHSKFWSESFSRAHASQQDCLASHATHTWRPAPCVLPRRERARAPRRRHRIILSQTHLARAIRHAPRTLSFLGGA